VPLQWTGLKDRNGVGIFEDDLIDDGGGQIGRIMWDGPTASFYIAFDADTQEIYAVNEWATVVGNIYENPELLK
jgi:hypothetical protein